MKHPPFCPDKDCPCYHQPKGNWYVKNGSFTTRRSGRVQKYRCKCCGTTFCSETFSIDYRTQRTLSYKRILTHLITSSGLRDISRDLGASCTAVTNRIGRLSRQAMAISCHLIQGLSIKEDLVADGIESFVCSQYAPNNINILAGKDSQFWFLSDYSQITRKGVMTKQQRERNGQIKELIKLNRTSIYHSFRNVARTALRLQEGMQPKSLILWTDEHLQYRQVMSLRDRDEMDRLHHGMISSKQERNGKNPLFSVNYLDREIRKDCADHTRETVQFARNTANMMDRLAIYRMYHNFIKPYRIDGTAEERSRCHGEVAGIASGQIRRELKSLFTRRRFLGKCPWMNSADVRVWLRHVTTPMKLTMDYLPGYALA